MPCNISIIRFFLLPPRKPKTMYIAGITNNIIPIIMICSSIEDKEIKNIEIIANTIPDKIGLKLKIHTPPLFSLNSLQNLERLSPTA